MVGRNHDRGDAQVPCEIDVPEPDGDLSLNYDKTDVVSMDSECVVRRIARVADASDCDNRVGGWYFSGPSDQRTITLCDRSCADVRQPDSQFFYSVGYPWGNAEADQQRARFFPQALDEVGSAPQGVARWGQHDLAGNVWEWGLDWLDTAWYAGDGTPCDDCARLQGSDYRVIRGGAYAFEAVTLRVATRSGEGPGERAPFIGFRCAAAPDL